MSRQNVYATGNGCVTMVGWLHHMLKEDDSHLVMNLNRFSQALEESLAVFDGFRFSVDLEQPFGGGVTGLI